MIPSPQYRHLWLPVVSALAFAFAYTQSPLYYSNQNQYFLHGLADAGYGDLSTDWLANTSDPTPLFSAMVYAVYRTVGPAGFQAIYCAVLMGYFLSLWGIVTALPFAPKTTPGQWFLAASLILIHSAIVRMASVQLFDFDYPWHFQTGVANQYLLGTGLQPSVFGVFLLMALAAAIRGRPLLAAGLCAQACAWHSTYLLPAGLIVFGLMVGSVRHKQYQTALLTGIVALLGVLPVLIYNLLTFAPTSSEQFVESQNHLAWLRIPHHTDVNRWFDLIAGIQLLGVLAGIVLLRRTPLGLPLAVAAGLAVVLSIIQVVSGDATLALMFPWRLSAVLVPLATMLLLTYFVHRLESINQPLLFLIAAIVLILISVIGAVYVSLNRLGYQESQAEAGLLYHVRETHLPNDLYLLPAGFPKPATKKGSWASTFVPVTQNGNPAIFELARFRLSTGAATFVDFKSVPYHDVEVLEWHRRVSKAAEWYAVNDWDESGILSLVIEEKVTHVVVPAGREIHSKQFAWEYEDSAYRVYRIRRAK